MLNDFVDENGNCGTGRVGTVERDTGTQNRSIGILYSIGKESWTEQ